MDEDLLVTQIGLIFSQVRYLRMAIDQVERSTARYAGVALDVAAAGPGRWGAPPLEAGALRVYVVNIGDLIAPDNSFLGVLSSAFRFATGAIGGIIGGAITGFALPLIVTEILVITFNIIKILEMIGLTGKKKPDGADLAEQSGTAVALIDRVSGTADKIARILGLANTEQKSGKKADTEESANWLQTMKTVEQIVRGLNLLVPSLIGAFAALLVRIDSLKIIILDLLEFALRNILILRGIILLTLYDTIGAAARLAAQLLDILATGINDILGALFRMLEAALKGALAAIELLSSALTTMVNALLPWLVDTVFAILQGLGRLPIFRMMFAFVEILPTILPQLLKMAAGGVDPNDAIALNAAKDRMIKGLAESSEGKPELPKMPDFAALAKGPLDSAATAIMDVATTIQKEALSVIRSAEKMMDAIAGQMQEAIGPHGENLNRGIRQGIGAITEDANALAGSLRGAQKAARETGGTGLELIATKYEEWLIGGGLRDIMTGLTAYFQTSPAASAGPASMLGQAVEAAQPMEPARPTVEIREVVVEITAAEIERAPSSGPHGHDDLDPDFEISPHEFDARVGIMTA